MNRLCELCIVFLLLFLGFWLLFTRIRWLAWMAEIWHRASEGMEEASRKRLLESRQRLLNMQKEHSLWNWLERQLQYSGLKRRLPFLTVERWAAANIAGISAVFLLLLGVGNWKAAWLGSSLVFCGEILALQAGKLHAMKRVNENLLKFLDFLGNYSITAGEVTGIFHQISKYMDEPLHSALEECSYQAQVTGDAGTALLVMAEKIEHPQFKELVRNMEISIRYSADFTVLVRGSRRSMRDYLKSREERKSMMREGVTNMVLLLGMAVFVLITVDNLIEVSVWQILLHTLPGKAALFLTGTILFLFMGQIFKIER